MDKKEMIIEIAMKIMGWIPTKLNWWMDSYGFNCDPKEADSWTFEYPGGVAYFDPFTKYEDAFRIVERLRNLGYTLVLLTTEDNKKPYICQFLKDDLQFSKEGKTSTEAISLAVIEMAKNL